jgi:hypothetical protein
MKQGKCHAPVTGARGIFGGGLNPRLFRGSKGAVPARGGRSSAGEWPAPACCQERAARSYFESPRPIAVPLLSVIVPAALACGGTSPSREVSFATADGGTVVADLYAASASDAVVLAHVPCLTSELVTLRRLRVPRPRTRCPGDRLSRLQALHGGHCTRGIAHPDRGRDPGWRFEHEPRAHRGQGDERPRAPPGPAPRRPPAGQVRDLLHAGCASMASLATHVRW